MSGRARPALRAATEARIARIPTVTITEVVHRAQWAGRSPWWFSSRTGNARAGRFDLEQPAGTCYVADHPVAALLEKLVDPEQEDPIVDQATVSRLRMWSGRLPARWARVADTTDRSSRVPKELGTVTPYTVAWQWADALHAAGRGGVRYWLRLDPGSGRGVAVFAQAGSPRQEPRWRERAATDFLDELATAVDVQAVPALDAFTLADEP